MHFKIPFTSRFSRSLNCLLTLVIAPVVFAQVPTAALQVDLQSPQKMVSPTLHGIFMEEIRHAFDGAENSLENPKRITPQEVPFNGCAPKFTVTLPSYSVNILRIPAKSK